MMEAVAAALGSGRSVIVPSPQRAAALGFAWARLRLAAGDSVWNSPEILTWDAWLRREWQRASERGLLPAGLSCLSASQEHTIWGQALEELDSGGPSGLRAFAPQLARAAARANQDGLRLNAAFATEEEALLISALAAVRRRIARDQCVALSLLSVGEIEAIAHSAPPLFVGQPLTALQKQIGERLWPGVDMHVPTPEPMGSPTFVRSANFESELAAVADWCQRLLSEDGSRRLLVVSALAKPDVPVLGDLLWRALSADSEQELSDRDPAILAIEGGEPLLQNGLIADAMDCLLLVRDDMEVLHLGRVLLGPYFGIGTDGERARLELELRDSGVARRSRRDLQRTLAILSSRHPMAGSLSQWLVHMEGLANEPAAPLSRWAGAFNDCLSRCRFAANSALDSREAQRLVRWHELLDEFAALDLVCKPLRCESALDLLMALATRGMHSAATGDAAITLTDDLGDPVAEYDGIWVMGLTESRWPKPPRPNPFVPLVEQRRCGWPEAGVTQRLQQARSAQSAWTARTSKLVQSYAVREADVRHRPSALLPHPGETWIVATAAGPQHRTGQARIDSDATLPPLGQAHGPRLGSGVRLLKLQQECAFHAQAELRLGAVALPGVGEGINKRLRGTLLHRTLEGLWREIAGQQRLLALDEAERALAFERHWSRAVNDIAPIERPSDPRVLERETHRARRVVLRILQLEAARAPFRVRAQEFDLDTAFAGRQLRLRIDRLDDLEDGRILVIDYKSGNPEAMRLHETAARPIQLAAYAAAMLAQATPVQGVTLLSLSPRKPGFKGAAADKSLLPPGIRELPDWEAEALRWNEEIGQLVTRFVGGDAQVDPLKDACLYCHLPSLCRITELAIDADESQDGEVEGVDE